MILSNLICTQRAIICSCICRWMLDRGTSSIKSHRLEDTHIKQMFMRSKILGLIKLLSNVVPILPCIIRKIKEVFKIWARCKITLIHNTNQMRVFLKQLSELSKLIHISLKQFQMTKYPFLISATMCILCSLWCILRTSNSQASSCFIKMTSFWQ